MFDTLGNYLYCSNCIKAAFRISNDRLAHQRSIKRNEAKNPKSNLPSLKSRSNALEIMS